ncbi:MAG: D-alanyl-D-alanine endopeptidase [Betaproteobacteria bacterium HGW-Betaproteobacteria-7]|jgi:D-alanyl-D-alanine endopeptidase (penicillin-binding protein 7)|nr:MAG: D-alanyl-D-alanine endopeptidase [Betaproteobacteria bacterium HGW-Betaproteobacteria-7]
MKLKFGALVVIAAMIGLVAPLQATTAKKAESQVGKKVASKPASKLAAKPRTKKVVHVASKTKGAKGTKVTKNSRRQVIANQANSPVRTIANDIDPGRLAIHSSSALVIDQTTGQIVLEKQPDTVVPIASITKLMTAMVVLDAGLDLHEVIAINDEDVDWLKGTRSRLPVGTTMTRETAMLLALMSSENRAANALGRHYPGGLPAFVQAMNRKAASLGMYSSRFEEPTGLSSNNVSTAHDLARMVIAAARYPEIRNYSTTAEARLEIKGRARDFGNTNALVRNDNWEIGISKTGYISEAGRCLVMQAHVAGKPVVIVLLDSNGKMTRVGDANRIKRWMESASVASGRRSA